jgi:hypothetical protein
MVSAFADDEPIIEWSDRGASFTPETVRGKVKTNGKKVSSEKIVWLGGIEFAGQFNFEDGSKHLVNQNGVESQSGNISSYPTPKSKNEDSRKFWNTIKKIKLGSPGQSNPSDGVTDIDPSTWETNYTSISRNYIDTGVNQKQWYYATVGGVQEATGCSPTAGSNIMVYWFNKGYTSLVPAFQNQVVMDLRTAMGTTQTSSGDGETSFTNIDDGLQAYARSHGRSNAVATNHDLANFSTVVTEIDAQRPVLQSYWNQTYFGNHTVTLVGYKHYVRSWYQSDSYYVVARNNFVNDTTFNIYVKWGTWNTNVVTTFVP